MGKSSLLNSLLRSKSAPVGNTPGMTKTIQEIYLDKDIMLLDSPGVIINPNDSSDSLLLKSSLKIEDIKDPISPI